MARTSNDTGRALEYIISEKFHGVGFNFGPLAIIHQKNFAPYFNALPSSQKALFETASSNILNWVLKSFPQIPKELEALADNSGSVVDIVLGTPSQTVNLSIKHNHLALRHNRPHGLANRCGVNQSLEDAYLDDLYAIEVQMRKEDPAVYFRTMKNKQKWMKKINENAKKHLESWMNASSLSVETYFGYLTSNDRPYYKIEVSNRFPNFVYVHEFLGNRSPSVVSLSFNHLDYLVLDYDNGWSIYKRLHNASSRIDRLSSTTRSSTGDWKWDVQLINQPNKKGFAL